MGKQTKSKKSEKRGKGVVTPVQIAFLVDRYLADNNFTSTRSSFRNEASDLISRSPVTEAPSSLLSLADILNEYINLKGQKVMLDQEKMCFEQEKFKVQTLLNGMQDVMNGYNSGLAAAAVPTQALVGNSGGLVPYVDPAVGSSAVPNVYHNSVVMSASVPRGTPANPRNFFTPMTNASSSKRRKWSKDVSDASNTAKRSCSQSATEHLQANYPNTMTQQSNVSNSGVQNSVVNASSHVDIPGRLSVQGSSVAKRLFNHQKQSLPMNSSGPITPPRVTSSPPEKSGSSPDVDPFTCDVTPQQMMSNCTVIASETITVSPAKQMGYYSIERNCRISASSPMKTNMKRCFSKRDNVKGRLDFDGPSAAMDLYKPVPCEVMASKTEERVDSFDFDLPNLDVFGDDFCFSELMNEFEINCDGMTCQPDGTPSPDDSLSGSPNTSDNAINGCNQVLSELSSSVTEIISEQNMSTPGPDSVTTKKSITKSIQILSPVKNQRSPSQEQDNVSATN
ncbi:polycystic kidney disease protein 1-like 3 [Heracleum sosnowskyi]|uniref:Polycystic kidney disease protein 1-like 3 n=1 Tax=Heracleum sosnowskyi TaxID=360622 RepID=A0AAD8I3Z5_9APIA|nr:polycystic kidney disease protein 1-like 3 [Heracleum sosnowskyi]